MHRTRHRPRPGAAHSSVTHRPAADRRGRARRSRPRPYDPVSPAVPRRAPRPGSSPMGSAGTATGSGPEPSGKSAGPVSGSAGATLS